METSISTLTVLYTYQLGGELHKLPYLYTFLQQLQRTFTGPVLLLDLGGSCTAGVWHCDATGGRSTLIVLDGMGYHAVNVSGFLTASVQEQIKTTLTTGMIDERRVWRYHVPPVRDEGILVATQETPALRLCIVAAPSPQTRLHSRTLFLQEVRPYEVGMVQISLKSQPELIAQAVYELPGGLSADPTISAAVEFVEEEAREFLNRRS